jgi:hypothetical protein
MSRLRRWVTLRAPRTRLLALGGIIISTVGSCGMPNIKPPSL